MKQILIFIALSVNSILVSAQELPLGYILQYKADFNNVKTPEDLIFSADCKNSISKGNLVLTGGFDSVQGFYPRSAALINNHIFGEYIVNLKLSPKLNDSDSASAVFLILGLRDSLNYYFVEMTAKETRFCSMYKGRKTTHQVDSSLVLENDKAITLIIKRNILERSINIQKNGEMVRFTDPNLVMGYFGFGVSNSELKLDEVTIWAPTSIEEPAPVFN